MSLHIGNFKTFINDNLSGKGLEIGPFFQPFKFNSENTVMTYQDRYTKAELIEYGKTHPEVIIDKIVAIDVVCNAHDQHFPDETFDFVCNSHVFEHMYNPVKALKNWIKQVKKNGYIYMIVPDKRYTFDLPRDITLIEHMISDYLHDESSISMEHYLDFYSKVHKNIENVDQYYKEQQDLHCHVFTYESLLLLLNEIKLFLPLTIVDHKINGMNICVLLKKE